ncbi:L-lysine 2-3-aminomutase [Penicillium sp. IBT 31633x]|nr:L-lysine 2-3-aminomutase [Penicillium sp. IBT 31633x]
MVRMLSIIPVNVHLRTIEISPVYNRVRFAYSIATNHHNPARAVPNTVLNSFKVNFHTYDHRVWKTGLPVRSAVLKPHAGELVVGWVTTSESSLLYVFVFASLKL